MRYFFSFFIYVLTLAFFEAPLLAVKVKFEDHVRMVESNWGPVVVERDAPKTYEYLQNLVDAIKEGVDVLAASETILSETKAITKYDVHLVNSDKQEVFVGPGGEVFSNHYLQYHVFIPTGLLEKYLLPESGHSLDQFYAYLTQALSKPLDYMDAQGLNTNFPNMITKLPLEIRANRDALKIMYINGIDPKILLKAMKSRYEHDSTNFGNTVLASLSESIYQRIWEGLDQRPIIFNQPDLQIPAELSLLQTQRKEKYDYEKSTEIEQLFDQIETMPQNSEIQDKNSETMYRILNIYQLIAANHKLSSDPHIQQRLKNLALQISLETNRQRYVDSYLPERGKTDLDKPLDISFWQTKIPYFETSEYIDWAENSLRKSFERHEFRNALPKVRQFLGWNHIFAFYKPEIKAHFDEIDLLNLHGKISHLIWDIEQTDFSLRTELGRFILDEYLTERLSKGPEIASATSVELEDWQQYITFFFSQSGGNLYNSPFIPFYYADQNFQALSSSGFLNERAKVKLQTPEYIAFQKTRHQFIWDNLEIFSAYDLLTGHSPGSSKTSINWDVIFYSLGIDKSTGYSKLNQAFKRFLNKGITRFRFDSKKGPKESASFTVKEFLEFLEENSGTLARFTYSVVKPPKWLRPSSYDHWVLQKLEASLAGDVESKYLYKYFGRTLFMLDSGVQKKVWSYILKRHFKNHKLENLDEASFNRILKKVEKEIYLGPVEYDILRLTRYDLPILIEIFSEHFGGEDPSEVSNFLRKLLEDEMGLISDHHWKFGGWLQSRDAKSVFEKMYQYDHIDSYADWLIRILNKPASDAGALKIWIDDLLRFTESVHKKLYKELSITKGLFANGFTVEHYLNRLKMIFSIEKFHKVRDGEEDNFPKTQRFLADLASNAHLLTNLEKKQDINFGKELFQLSALIKPGFSSDKLLLRLYEISSELGENHGSWFLQQIKRKKVLKQETAVLLFRSIMASRVAEIQALKTQDISLFYSEVTNFLYVLKSHLPTTGARDEYLEELAYLFDLRSERLNVQIEDRKVTNWKTVGNLIKPSQLLLWAGTAKNSDVNLRLDFLEHLLLQRQSMEIRNEYLEGRIKKAINKTILDLTPTGWGDNLSSGILPQSAVSLVLNGADGYSAEEFSVIINAVISVKEPGDVSLIETNVLFQRLHDIFDGQLFAKLLPLIERIYIKLPRDAGIAFLSNALSHSHDDCNVLKFFTGISSKPDPEFLRIMLSGFRDTTTGKMNTEDISKAFSQMQTKINVELRLAQNHLLEKVQIQKKLAASPIGSLFKVLYEGKERFLIITVGSKGPRNRFVNAISDACEDSTGSDSLEGVVCDFLTKQVAPGTELGRVVDFNLEFFQEIVPGIRGLEATHLLEVQSESPLSNSLLYL